MIQHGNSRTLHYCITIAFGGRYNYQEFHPKSIHRTTCFHPQSMECLLLLPLVVRQGSGYSGHWPIWIQENPGPSPTIYSSYLLYLNLDAIHPFRYHQENCKSISYQIRRDNAKEKAYTKARPTLITVRKHN